MSVLIERSMGDLNKEKLAVYPLFQKGATPQPQPPKKRASQDNLKTSNETAIPADVPKTVPARRSKKAKPKAVVDANLQDGHPPPIQNDVGQGELLEVDPNNGRRKRRKIASDGGEPSMPQPLYAAYPALQAVQAPLQPYKTPYSALPVTPVPTPSYASHPPEDSQMNDTPASLSTSSLKKHSGAVLDNIIPFQDKLPEQVRITSSPPLTRQDAPCSSGLPQDDLLKSDERGLILDTTLGGKPVAMDQETTQPPSAVSGSIGAVHPPRKVLRFNAKTGTIGSPPAKKTSPVAAPNRKKPTASRGQPKSKVIMFQYGEGRTLPESIGEKIDQILNGTITIPPVEKTKPPKVVKRSSPQPAKSTHPFFLGKAATKDPSPQEPSSRRNSIIDLTGPGKLILQPRTQPLPNSKVYSPTKPSVPFSSFGAAKITKFPGAVEPAWPYKDMVHVRGLSIEREEDQHQSTISPYPASGGKRGKYQATRIEQGENILDNLSKELCISNVVDNIRDVNPHEFLPFPDCLRIPKKLLISGSDVQRRVREELNTRLPVPRLSQGDSSEDDIQQPTHARPNAHPAILKTYNLISKTLSAFDRGICETLPWTHKYAPSSASNVLQTGQNVPILRDWLESLTVKAVAGLGSDNGTSASSKPSSARADFASKRKRKTKKLDDFIVSSDEDADELEEVSDGEDAGSCQGIQRQLRTLVRRGDATKDSGRAVVISGPHGCGKTAAVYAAAKELGFDVFELNPGSRRNGKDILDRVGDMAHNHQVQRVSGLAQVDGAAEEDRRKIDEALANDLKSGRQGTMISFFKSDAPVKAPTKPKPKTTPMVTAASVPTQQTLGNKSTGKPKAQKQSLILIEEADILYKEDTQFWSTVQELIRTSKRPVVITCNDEFPIPLGIIPLHAVIRMTPPPVALAVDYMLLVAACEGHLIRRAAIETLYQNRGMDLRAALTDLNYWCQFGIGDQKNGLSWYLPRWPRGNDVDKNGNAIRVISKGTYKLGMGLLSQDILESSMHHLDVEEETLHQACDGWNLDIGHWQESLDMASWARSVQGRLSGKTGFGPALQAYEEFAESMSAADICSGSLFSSDNQLAIDASLPELTSKSRDDFTLASRLLEASTTVTYNPLEKDISLWVKSRGRNYLQVQQHVKMDVEVPIELGRPVEADFIRMIKSKSIETSSAIDRRDFSNAFDPISYPEKPSFSNSDKIEMSVFDRTTRIIAEDMGPYVRSIVDFDSRLQADRERLSNLLSESGRKGKRMRTTRAAMSALEGGARSTTRKEKYFGSLLNPYIVMKTGMQSWTEAARAEMSAFVNRSRRASTVDSGEEKSDNEEDELMHK